MPTFLKSMDATEGRNIATWAMLPLWEGFTASAPSGNMSAWEAIETVKDLAFCMIQTLVEENGRHTKNVPLSYDFTKVCRHLNCSFKIFYFSGEVSFSKNTGIKRIRKKRVFKMVEFDLNFLGK